MSRRHSYEISFKLQVIKYAKENGNRAAERHFGPPPTEKMIRTWRRQENELKETKCSKHNLRKGVVKWPQLEEDVRTWLLDQRRTGISVSTKMIIHKAKCMADGRGFNDFSG